MRFSVIVSTYQKPRDLERSLWGWALQSDRDFELLIADDGSGPETAAVIDRLRREASLPVNHVWHEDRGFRKTEILNRAILASSGDYLLFTDGDCIPRADLVATHRALAEPGRFLASGYIRLPEAVSNAISLDDVRSGRFADLAWLLARGWRPGRRGLRLVRSARFATLFDMLTPTKPLFAGNNTSAWRSDIEAVNGFDLTMGYGGEDRAVGYRLENLGVRGKQIRHRAVCIHLYHDHPYREPEVVRQNRVIMREIRRLRLVRAERGLTETGLRPEGDGRRDSADEGWEDGALQADA